MRMLGRRAWSYSLFLPTDLPQLAQRVRVPAHELLWKHTVFPYAVAFMSPATVALLEAKALAGCGEGDTSLSSLVKSVTHSLPSVRYCPRCAQEDLKEFGESYWHRGHCLPATHVCVKHWVPLHRPAAVPVTFSGTLLTPLPHRQNGPQDGPPAAPWAATRLAINVHRVLASHWRYRPQWLDRHREWAGARGFWKTERDLAGARLAHDLQQSYGKEYLAEQGCAFTSVGSPWPALMVRTSVEVPFSPTKHLLLSTFLEHGPAPSTNFVYPLPGKKPSNKDELDTRLADAVMQEAAALIERGARTTVKGLLEATGFWQTYRHAHDRLPLTKAQIAAFRESEASERKAGGRAAHRKRRKLQLAESQPLQTPSG
jgi:hypothetical protein